MGNRIAEPVSMLRLLFDLTEAHLQELERKGMLPKGM
jgi:hypothetical protein